MNLKLSTLLVCLLLAPPGASAKTILPGSCGDPAVKFRVRTLDGQPAPPAPAEGKAQLILAEDQSGKYESIRNATVRYGLDGSWQGANYGNSYFAVAVDPGVHQLCANWQGESDAEVVSFTAEAGKVYYFDFQIAVTTIGRGYRPPASPNGGGGLFSRDQNRAFVLRQLTVEDGLSRLKGWRLSTLRPRPSEQDDAPVPN